MQINGSNPATPTQKKNDLSRGFFFFVGGRFRSEGASGFAFGARGAEANFSRCG